jgi:hypothetical protein
MRSLWVREAWVVMDVGADVGLYATPIVSSIAGQALIEMKFDPVQPRAAARGWSICRRAVHVRVGGIGHLGAAGVRS